MKHLFYRLMHFAYDKVYGRQQMLHYPLYKKPNQDLLEGQMQFTQHCLSHLSTLDGKRVLDVGCGNGIQTIYIHETFSPEHTQGIDIDPKHIEQARAESARRGLRQIEFAVDNAELLASAADASVDVVVCVESAHHYPDKGKFLEQVKRVLRPGGHLVIADLLQRNGQPPSFLDRKMEVYHWPWATYLEKFRSLNMSVVKDEDLTELILPAFQDTERWFPPPPKVQGMSYKLGRLIGRSLISIYVHQLTNTLQYRLMLCRKG